MLLTLSHCWEVNKPLLEGPLYYQKKLMDMHFIPEVKYHVHTGFTIGMIGSNTCLMYGVFRHNRKNAGVLKVQ